MYASRLVTVLLVGLLVLSACKGDSPTPPTGGDPTLADVTLAETTVGASYAASLSASGGTAPYVFSAQGLPPGITLASDSGALSGAATAAGDFQVQATVKDANGKQALKTFPLKVHPPVSFQQGTLPAATVGALYSVTLELEGGKAPLTLKLVTGALPVGVTFNASTRQISGTFSEAATLELTFEATDVHGAKATQSYSLNVVGPLSVAVPPDAYQGQAYSQQIAVGGKPPYSFAIQSGSLPPGLSFTSAGQLAGTPQTPGTTNLSFTLSDSSGKTVNGTFSLTIYAPPQLTTTSYPEAYVGDSYASPSAATGGKAPLTWSVSAGALPAGVSLKGTTGQLTGTPTEAGTFSFTLRVSDANGVEATRPLQVVIYALPEVTSVSPLPAAYAGQPYTVMLTASGGKGTPTFTLASGALPTGLTLSNNGTIGSTVNSAVAQGTKSTFSVQVQDSNGRTGSKPLEITTWQLPRITSTSLTPATEGVDYRRSEASTERVQAQFGQGTLTFSAMGLPPGLSIDGATGEFTGTPAQGSAGAYSVTFQVQDVGNRSTSKTLDLQVVTPQPVRSGGVSGVAPEGGRLTDTLTVFVTNGRLPLADVGVRVRRNGQEYAPPKEALTNAEGKVVFTGLGLNGTTDTADITANGKELVNTTLAGINASVVTMRMFSIPVPGPRYSATGAYDPASKRFLITSGLDSSTSNSIFYSSCLNDMVEAVDVTQKRFATLVPGGLSTSPSPRYDGAMGIAGGAAVLFGGRNCIDTGDSLGDTWEFQLASNTWAPVTPSGSKPAPRRAASLVSNVAGDALYMVGGYRNPFYSDEVWRYTPATHTWTQVGTAPFARAWAGSTTQTVTGELWFCGGRSASTSTECQAFNPTAGTWSVKPSLPSGRSEFTMAFDPFTETLYAFGGRAADASPFGDLLVLPKGASAWQSVIPSGAAPAPRYGHVMYFDLTRKVLVVALGQTRDPITLSTSRLGDVWTYDGQKWMEQGPAPAAPGYAVSGQITGGPASGTAWIHVSTPSGSLSVVAVTLDVQGRGTYTVPNVPPGELLLMSVVGEDSRLGYPKNLWTYAEVSLPGLVSDVTRNISLPPGPAVVLQVTGSYQLPASWHGQTARFVADSFVEAPGFPYMLNGVATSDEATHQFGIAFLAPAATAQERLGVYAASELLCEDHNAYKPVGAGPVNLSPGAAVTGMSPGQPECTPQGSRGVGAARIRASATAVTRVAVADLDGDTLPELLLPQPTRTNLGLLWGTPSVINAFTDFSCCIVDSAHSVAAGDFNKDGRLDLAVTEPGQNSVKVMLASGTVPRTFLPYTAYPVGTSPSGLAVADVNGDGFQDLLVANQGSNTVSILYGGANGAFTAGSQVALAGTAPSQVLVTNVDGDTLPDLVVLVAEGISVALDGFTQGPFGNSTLVLAGSQPSAVVVGRLNADALPDMAVANAGSNNVSLLFGAGSGTFGTVVNLSGFQAPAGLVLAELTGDTHLDLAVSSPTDGAVTVLQGASNGTFTTHSQVPVPGDPRGMAVVDFNGDGFNDLAVASPTANGVYLLLGQRPAPTSPGTVFAFTAPADAGLMWSMHRINGQRRYWDYYAPIQPGPVSYSLPLPSTLAPSSAPVAPATGKVELAWTPYVTQWEPNATRPFNPRQFVLANLGADADTQPGASHYFWP